MMITFAEELSLKWLAKEYMDEHRAPESTNFYSWILDMVMTEERALKTMKSLLDKNLIVYHKDKVMHPLYFDEFYNEDFDSLDKKYNFRAALKEFERTYSQRVEAKRLRNKIFFDSLSSDLNRDEIIKSICLKFDIRERIAEKHLVVYEDTLKGVTSSVLMLPPEELVKSNE